MDNVAYFVEETYTKDALNQRVPSTTKREIFVEVDTVSRSEWFNAGRSGLNAQYKITTAAVNYSGETKIELDGTMYSVYRTFMPNDDDIEIYLKKEAGTYEHNT